MAHTAAGYEFTLRGSRATLWIACVGSVLGIVVGIGFGVLSLLEEHLLSKGGAVPPPTVLAALVVLPISVFALRRSLVVANECRIGEAGIFTRTLLRPEQFIPWIRFREARFAGRLLRISYDTADGIEGETWVEIPRGQGANALRMKTFLAEKQRAFSERRTRESVLTPT